MPRYLIPLAKYATFQGRASRAEFFGFSLVVLLVVFGILLLTFVADAQDMPGLWTALIWTDGVFVLGAVVPMWAVGVRRMHDRGLSGWWQLITFVPYVGGLIWLWMTCGRGMAGANLYGVDPLFR